MNVVPKALRGLMAAFEAEFSPTVFVNFVTLMLSAIVTTGRHTVSQLIRNAGALADAHPSSYHRVLSQRVWSPWPLAKALATCIINTFLPTGSIMLVGDETVTEHTGKRVFGKGMHRDAKRSSNNHVAHLFGHKWVVLAILVQLPMTHRPWALPVLVALYRSPPKGTKKSQNKDHTQPRHKTPCDIMRQLVAAFLL